MNINTGIHVHGDWWKLRNVSEIAMRTPIRKC